MFADRIDLSPKTIVQIARLLPADLGVLARLGTMLQDVNSELSAIATLLRGDVALAARIVRISNSATFGSSGGIASVEDAVNRVGFTEILRLVGTATAARFAHLGLENYGITARRLRDNILYGAFASEALARASGADARVAYTAGLLRPIGLMILNQAARDYLAPGRHFIPAEWPSYSAWELHSFGVDHCEVAALVLDEWRFPEELGQAIRSHSMARPEDLTRPLAALLNVANGLAHRVSRSFPGEVHWWEITKDRLLAAGLTEQDFEPAIVGTEAAFEAAIAATSG